MSNVKEFVSAYIQREYTVPVEQDIMTLNYVDEGYIDSMGYIQFIATIEDEFDVEFEVEEIANPDTKIVWKLIELIESKRR